MTSVENSIRTRESIPSFPPLRRDSSAHPRRGMLSPPPLVEQLAASHPSVTTKQLPPLGGVVAVVSLAHPKAASLPHVLALVSSFLDRSGGWDIVRACSVGFSPSLLRRVHERERLEPSVDPFYREWQVSRSVTLAAGRGDLDAVRWLLTEYASGHVLTDGAEAAAKNGHLHVLKWLHDDYGRAAFDMHEMWLAAESGHLEVLHWLQSISAPRDTQQVEVQGGTRCTDFVFGCRTPALRNLLETAGSNGHLQCAKWLASEISKWMQQREEEEQSSEAFRADLTYYYDVDRTAANGHIDVLRWLKAENFPWLDFVSSREVMCGAAQKGDLDMLKWIHRTFSNRDDFGASSIDAAALGGRLEAVDWMYETGAFNWSAKAIAWAAHEGHLEILRWLHERENERRPMATDCGMDAVMRLAAKRGHLHILQFLRENWSAEVSVEVMDSAATAGHLDVVQWLHTNRTEGCTALAMDGAAANGHLDVVDWLSSNRSEGCTAAAMDEAAKHGHLNMVKWLHVHRTEGCSFKAMDGAATNGYLDVVEWLHANRSEGCSTHALDKAAANGHIEMVQWLHQHRSAACTADAMDKAAENGKLDVVRWLHENRVEGCTSSAIDCAAHAGHFEVLLFLRSYRTEGCSARAFTGAYEKNRLEILRWLAFNFPDQFNRDDLLEFDSDCEAKPYMLSWLQSGHF
jgi:hypothetical protein